MSLDAISFRERIGRALANVALAPYYGLAWPIGFIFRFVGWLGVTLYRSGRLVLWAIVTGFKDGLLPRRNPAVKVSGDGEGKRLTEAEWAKQYGSFVRFGIVSGLVFGVLVTAALSAYVLPLDMIPASQWQRQSDELVILRATAEDPEYYAEAVEALKSDLRKEGIPLGFLSIEDRRGYVIGLRNPAEDLCGVVAVWQDARDYWSVAAPEDAAPCRD